MEDLWHKNHILERQNRDSVFKVFHYSEQQTKNRGPVHGVVKLQECIAQDEMLEDLANIRTFRLAFSHSFSLSPTIMFQSY
jgi:hypothetical protein